MKTKTCTLCGRTLPLTMFGKHKLGKDGLNYWCKDCNREKQREFSKTPSGIYTAMKSRQKFYEKNQPWRYKPVNISRTDFINWFDSQPQKCHYCGLKLEELSKVDDFYNNKSERLSVDVVGNKLGYELGNLVVCCHRCNGIKSDFLTYEEMLYIGQNFVKPKWIKMLSGENSE